MKKIAILVLTSLILISCNSDKKMSPDFIGHWVNEDFYNHITNKKDLLEYSGEKIEFVIPETDTNYTLINFMGKISSGPLELMDNEHLVIKNYFGNYKNADLLLTKDKLEFVNNETSEKITFKKIKLEEIGNNEAKHYSTYCLPLINKNYLAGKYLLNNDTVQFNELGKIQNLDKFENFALCLNSDCRNSDKYNSIFLSNKNNEGNYYDYLVKTDSLIIYEIDEVAFARGMKGGNVGIKYALKKIN